MFRSLTVPTLKVTPSDPCVRYKNPFWEDGDLGYRLVVGKVSVTVKGNLQTSLTKEKFNTYRTEEDHQRTREELKR